MAVQRAAHAPTSTGATPAATPPEEGMPEQAHDLSGKALAGYLRASQQLAQRGREASAQLLSPRKR